MSTSRRRFLSDVGRGMIAASVGASLATDLGLSSVAAAETEGKLTFGPLDSLVDFLQSTPADQMLPAVIGKIKAGMKLEELVAAAALANARAFAGEDYIGFHTLMALGPALEISRELDGDWRTLAVLKVLYRNSARIGEVGAATNDRLKPVAPASASGDSAEQLRQLVREQNRAQAEAVFAAQTSPSAALNDLLVTVEDATEVHRVVLVHRAWEMVSLVGSERAHTMLRQSLRYCLKNEPYALKHASGVRTLLPKLLDQHRLAGRTPGTRTMDDKRLGEFVDLLFASTADQAADAVAGALADGFAPASLGEAISLAANQLVLRDAGRRGREIQPGKPEGSVHGDSIGVHACDSANAWRNIATYGDDRHKIAATILAGYQVALDRVQRGGDFANWQPRPTAETLSKVSDEGKCKLLGELALAIRANDQERACAVTLKYLDCQHSEGNLFRTLAQFAVSEDGALHAEKYYRTATSEFAATRPAFRNRQLIALARVTASEFGRPAPGFERAKELLKG